ncbi:MAG: DNA topoisomerase I [Candidatus Jacksonbacteria bacterium RIFCSPLOWO2_01_FULL_44_13]|nr:MAG: DNA topoisomerase I [Candidatus Jacksonbacteria bacterium RIFCSPLOWO2_01_FULL_44_13]
MKLVIVESPTKAKTISRFLGKGYTVESSFGHIRDLPQKTMGLDIEHDFKPHYVTPKDKLALAKKLKTLAAKADEIYFATDEDREGEAIAWHLVQLLKPPKEKIKRITFHEITKHAIETALEHPRTIDQDLVDAQQGRRILDRLVGYELSPFLWRKVAKGLSAGRVQSVAVRLIVDREREIEKFTQEEYWTLMALLAPQTKTPHRDVSTDVETGLTPSLQIEASLYAKDGKKYDKLDIKSKEMMDEIVCDLEGASYTIESIEKKEKKRNPYPPFTTSTLQQSANNRLGMSAKQTMRIAQQLYEGVDIGEHGSVGLITYMRTDSFNLADKFLTEARDYIEQSFGKNYLPESPNRYKTKSKGAQEAHEAIRPTDPTLTPEYVKPYLDSGQYRLYRLIWQRAVASQMTPAIMDQTTISIQANQYTFHSTGSIIKFPGFMKVYSMKTEEKLLPQLSEKEKLDLQELNPEQHFTEPPPRYTEASLVKALEERGIGRPSTYAPTISTIIERNYVEKEEKKLKPTEIGTIVNDVLVEHFPNIVDFEFTAKMEQDLDEIADNHKEWVPMMKEFYEPFKKNLTLKDKELKKSDITEEKTDEICEKCNKPMVIKIGRYGKFLACTGYPECKNTHPIDSNGDPIPEKEPIMTDEKCEKCGKPMVKKDGRFGPFLACSDYPTCKSTKNIEQSTGITCPACKKGEIIAKRSRRGKPFWACNQYPDCENAYWGKPTGETCPVCTSLIVQSTKDTTACSDKKCSYKT